MFRIVVFITTFLCGFLPLAYADLTIEITEGIDNPTVIAVVPTHWSAYTPSEDISSITAADLERSGQFQALARNDMLSLPTQQSEVFYRDWRALGVEYLVVMRGMPKVGANNILEVTMELYDVYRQRRLLKAGFSNTVSEQRAIAHAISDAVYEKLTGIKGAFSTRIVYVSVRKEGQGQRYELVVADADGARSKAIVSSSEPILSPSWSPNGRDIAYVSFETGTPAIYQQNLATGHKQRLTHFKGLNSAPAWSPDGTKLAMVLSKDGNPELYIMDLASRALKRLTNHYSIDTEPAWTPNGQSLLFTSDRGGKPQVYSVEIATGKIERVTYSGDYNARSSVLPDGRHMIMVHRRDGAYHIALQDLERNNVTVLTDSSMDESPSIAPNGSMLLYATKYRGKGVLAAVSVDGRVKFRLPSSSSDVREPAWSPYLR